MMRVLDSDNTQSSAILTAMYIYINNVKVVLKHGPFTWNQETSSVDVDRQFYESFLTKPIGLTLDNIGDH